ncbi:TPA: hypothetical protein LA827_003500 [Clostridium botulinum]|nr:hypothetical protein [Clostridium botulinum]
MNVKKRKTPRKRCNRCVHLIYTYIESINKYGYKCEITGQRRGYLDLKLCNDFKKKILKNPER